MKYERYIGHIAIRLSNVGRVNIIIKEGVINPNRNLRSFVWKGRFDDIELEIPITDVVRFFLSKSNGQNYLCIETDEVNKKKVLFTMLWKKLMKRFLNN